jgi:hypothetical protein
MMALSIGERVIPVIFSYLSEFDSRELAGGVAVGAISVGGEDDASEVESGSDEAYELEAAECAVHTSWLGLGVDAQEAAQTKPIQTAIPPKRLRFTSVLMETAIGTPEPSRRALQR